MRKNSVMLLIYLFGFFYFEFLFARPISVPELIKKLDSCIGNILSEVKDGSPDEEIYYGFYRIMQENKDSWSQWSGYFREVDCEGRRCCILSSHGVLEVLRKRYGKTYQDKDIQFIVLCDNHELTSCDNESLKKQVELNRKDGMILAEVSELLRLRANCKAVKMMSVLVFFFHQEFKSLQNNQYRIYLLNDPNGHISTVFLRKSFVNGIAKFRATIFNSVDSTYTSLFTEKVDLYGSSIATSLAIAGKQVCPEDHKVYLLPGCMQKDKINCLQFTLLFVDALLHSPVVPKSGYQIEKWNGLPFSLWMPKFKDFLSPCYE